MNLHVDHKTAQLSAETRRLWNDERVWVVNCLAVEAAFADATRAERSLAERGRDQILAAFIEAW